MKGFVTIIVAVLIVIILCWIGISVYDASNDVEINPNAEQYIKPIKPEFDLEAVDVVTEKIDKLPVSQRYFTFWMNRQIQKNYLMMPILNQPPKELKFIINET